MRWQAPLDRHLLGDGKGSMSRGCWRTWKPDLRARVPTHLEGSGSCWQYDLSDISLHIRSPTTLHMAWSRCTVAVPRSRQRLVRCGGSSGIARGSATSATARLEASRSVTRPMDTGMELPLSRREPNRHHQCPVTCSLAVSPWRMLRYGRLGSAQTTNSHAGERRGRH